MKTGDVVRVRYLDHFRATDVTSWHIASTVHLEAYGHVLEANDEYLYLASSLTQVDGEEPLYDVEAILLSAITEVEQYRSVKPSGKPRSKRPGKK